MGRCTPFLCPPVPPPPSLCHLTAILFSATPFLPITLGTSPGRQRRVCRTCPLSHPRRCLSSCLATVLEIVKRDEVFLSLSLSLTPPLSPPIIVLCLVSLLCSANTGNVWETWCTWKRKKETNADGPHRSVLRSIKQLDNNPSPPGLRFCSGSCCTSETSYKLACLTSLFRDRIRYNVILVS